MRIALITREFPPETAWGGIGSFYANLARALAGAGHDVEVFTQAQRAASQHTWHGARVWRVLPPKRIVGDPTGGDLAGADDIGEFASALALSLFQAFLRRHHEAPFDVVESHEHLGSGFYINFHSPSDCTTVVRYHSAYHTFVTRRLVDWPESRLVTRLEHEACLLADVRIASSNVIDAAMQEDFCLPPADVIIHNLVSDPASAKSIPSTKENLVAFVGRLVKAHKRPDMATVAFASISSDFADWRFEIAGADMTNPDGTSVWGECITKLHDVSSNRFRYHGVLSSPELVSLYRRAKLLLVPSTFESFGMVAVEAMREGCVPIVSSGTALADIVADSRCVFHNGDQASLNETLRFWLNEPSLLAEMSDQMRRRAREFSEDALLRQNLALFGQVSSPAWRRQARAATRSAASLAQRPKVAPLISIVTPSYNQGEYIAETISSILAQDYPQFEHIVVDGGSTDNTLNILRKYPHLDWSSEKDLGQTHAINKGLLRAHGEILAYLNSDDVYRPGTFHAVAKVFRDHPEAQIVVGNCDIIDARSEITGHLTAKAADASVLLQYWLWADKHCIPQQSVFFRRSLLAEVGLFNTNFHMVMDYEFWLRVAQRHSFFVLDKTLAAFRVVPTTKTGARTDEMYLEEYAASRTLWNTLSLFERVRIAMKARRQVARKMLDLAEHLWLRTSQGRRPLRLLRVAALYWAPIILSPRFLLSLAGAISKGPNAISSNLNRIHHQYLAVRWR